MDVKDAVARGAAFEHGTLYNYKSQPPHVAGGGIDYPDARQIESAPAQLSVPLLIHQSDLYLTIGQSFTSLRMCTGL